MTGAKDGVFVFHDPKLDEELNLLFESPACRSPGYRFRSIPEALAVENAKVYKELRRGRIDAALASRLSQILINQRVILESFDAEKRISQLEALLEKAGHGKLLPLKASNG